MFSIDSAVSKKMLIALQADAWLRVVSFCWINAEESCTETD